MRKMTFLVVAVLAALASPSLAAGGSRTTSRDYTVQRAHVRMHESDPWVGTQQESFEALRGERWVTLSVEDASGRPVRARIDVAGSTFEFCGVTDHPLRVRPGQEIGVSAVFGTCGSEPSVVTQGTITATFSKHGH